MSLLDNNFVHSIYGDYLGVDYERFIPYLIGGVNETNKKLDNKTFELEKAEEVIFDYDKVNYDQNELIENQKKNIKFLNVQNKLLKVAIPVTIVATVLTTILIVK